MGVLTLPKVSSSNLPEDSATRCSLFDVSLNYEQQKEMLKAVGEGAGIGTFARAS